YRYTPADLRMLMIDPKMVELSMYNALPHLRHAVVTNNHDAARVLKWAVHEMNRRYELLHANGARNPADFSRTLDDGKPLRHPPHPRHPAALGERHHRPHQGEFPESDRLPRRLQGGQPDDPRRQRRRSAARQWGHALSAPRQERAAADPGRLHRYRGDRAADG